jgi:hypothetical protein
MQEYDFTVEKENGRQSAERDAIREMKERNVYLVMQESCRKK